MRFIHKVGNPHHAPQWSDLSESHTTVTAIKKTRPHTPRCPSSDACGAHPIESHVTPKTKLHLLEKCTSVFRNRPHRIVPLVKGFTVVCVVNALTSWIVRYSAWKLVLHIAQGSCHGDAPKRDPKPQDSPKCLIWMQ
jgi:hypothetical protein